MSETSQFDTGDKDETDVNRPGFPEVRSLDSGHYLCHLGILLTEQTDGRSF
jgi:hypothetical protein